MSRTPNYAAYARSWKRVRWILWVLIPLLAWTIFEAVQSDDKDPVDRWVGVAVPLLVVGQTLFYCWKSRESTKPDLPVRG